MVCRRRIVLVLVRDPKEPGAQRSGAGSFVVR
jgi:hypothetical protein